jgi:hypothetical protein
MNDLERRQTRLSLFLFGLLITAATNERRRGIGIGEVNRSIRSTERLIPIFVWTVTVAVHLKSSNTILTSVIREHSVSKQPFILS